jgi:hypothetical protein
MQPSAMTGCSSRARTASLIKTTQEMSAPGGDSPAQQSEKGSWMRKKTIADLRDHLFA